VTNLLLQNFWFGGYWGNKIPGTDQKPVPLPCSWQRDLLVYRQAKYLWLGDYTYSLMDNQIPLTCTMYHNQSINQSPLPAQYITINQSPLPSHVSQSIPLTFPNILQSIKSPLPAQCIKINQSPLPSQWITINQSINPPYLHNVSQSINQ